MYSRVKFGLIRDVGIDVDFGVEAGRVMTKAVTIFPVYLFVGFVEEYFVFYTICVFKSKFRCFFTSSHICIYT